MSRMTVMVITMTMVMMNTVMTMTMMILVMMMTMMMKITMLLMAGMSGDSVSVRLTLILLPHPVLKDKNNKYRSKSLFFKL